MEPERWWWVTATAALLLATAANSTNIMPSTAVCETREDGEEMRVEGRLVTRLLQQGERNAPKTHAKLTTLVMDTSAAEVVVRCRRPYGRGSLRMFDGEGKEIAESEYTASQQEGQQVWTRLWRTNYSALWHSEKVVECRRGEERGCRVRILQANTMMQPQANCTRDNGHLLWCNISEWVEETDKQRSGGICEEGKLYHKAHFRYSFYNSDTQEWTTCGEFDERRTAAVRDKDVAFLQCNISGITQAKEPLILRMEKNHMSQSGAALLFMNKLDCSESTYLTIPGDVLAPPDEIINTATAASIAVFATAFILILFACLLRQLRRRRKKAGQLAGVVAYSNSYGDLSYVKSERPLIPDAGESSPGGPESSGSRSREEEEEASAQDVDNYLPMSDADCKEKLVDNLLNGNLERVNPDLPLTHQTRVLNYDKRFEVTRHSFTIGHIIGEGQYGTVFVGTAKGIYGQEITKVAIKQVKDTLDPSQISTIIDELKILSNLQKHLNLVNLLGACTSQLSRHEIYLLLEFCPFGDMKKYLVEKREKFLACLNNEPGHMESVFNSRLLLSWAYSIAKGMEYLASN